MFIYIHCEIHPWTKIGSDTRSCFRRTKKAGCGVSLGSGRQTFDMDVRIVLESCLGELHATFGIGASCGFYSQPGSHLRSKKSAYLRFPDASLKNCAQELNYMSVLFELCSSSTHLYLSASSLLCFEGAQSLAAQIHAPNFSLCNSTYVPIYHSSRVDHIPFDQDTYRSR